MGSPPRMRGQEQEHRVYHAAHRITPADAGTSFCRPAAARFARDPPRGCGDKGMLAGKNGNFWGSPPRMRGQAAGPWGIAAGAGITPADAGTSTGSQNGVSNYMDHPRGCGDKGAHFPVTSLRLGSPPRMRGQAWPQNNFPVSRYITPADAGTSLVPAPKSLSCQDHPRGCGDKCTRLQMRRPRSGSPPRMRGQVGVEIPPDTLGRITPADAGTSIIIGSL